jgi:hypothetical protein
MRSLLSLLALLYLFFFAPVVRSSTLLQGRVEEIFNKPSVKLPLELRATELKLPSDSSQPRYLQPELKSFPSILRGDWKGELQVKQFTCSQAYLTEQPADAETEQEVAALGKWAQSCFTFYTPRKGLVTMAPPEVKIVDPDPQSADHFQYIAVQDFGASTQWVSASGVNKVKMSLLKNEVKMLSPTVVEQDMVIEKLLTDPRGKQIKKFVEQVFRFTKVGPFELSVQLAEVNYGGDGRWWSKLLLEGDVH